MVVACLQPEIDNGENRKLAATLEKAESAKSLPFAWQWVPIYVGAYFFMGLINVMWLL